MASGINATWRLCTISPLGKRDRGIKGQREDRWKKTDRKGVREEDREANSYKQVGVQTYILSYRYIYIFIYIYIYRERERDTYIDIRT